MVGCIVVVVIFAIINAIITILWCSLVAKTSEIAIKKTLDEYLKVIEKERGRAVDVPTVRNVSFLDEINRIANN